MVGNLREIAYCEVCKSTKLKPVLNLGMHPLCDDLIPINQMRECKEYPIEILHCPICQTSHQKFQIDKELLFPADYHYRSRNTADVLNGMKGFVNTCSEKLLGIENKKVLDVGCNDGSLLNYFKKKGAITFGIEPTDAVFDAQASGHIILKGFLTEGLAQKFISEHGHVDLITFTNVFAHIEDLDSVLNCINILRHSKTRVIIENHYLGSILEKNQFDTFYHEHPRTYSYGSFIQIAENIDMSVGHVEFPSRYGGNIRIILEPKSDSTTRPESIDNILKREKVFFSDCFQRMAKKINKWRFDKKKEILNAVELSGPLVAKAFPGRASIPIKLLELDQTMVKAVYEKPGSQKIGHWIPGTKIPIVSDTSILNDIPSGAPVLNLAWHIDDEIRTYMKLKGFYGSFINII